MKERIEKILDSYNLSPSKFADELGIQRSGISHVLSGRNKPSLEFVQKVLIRFPEISSDWLVQGIGAMKKEWMDPNQISMFDHEVFQTTESFVKPVNHASQPAVVPLPEEPVAATPSPLHHSNGHAAPLQMEVPAQEALPPVTIPSSSKKIERIVIFYSDKTFAEYRHE